MDRRHGDDKSLRTSDEKMVPPQRTDETRGDERTAHGDVRVAGGDRRPGDERAGGGEAALPADTPGEVREHVDDPAHTGHEPAHAAPAMRGGPDDKTRAHDAEAKAAHDAGGRRDLRSGTPGTAKDGPGPVPRPGAPSPGSEAWSLFGRDAEEILRRWHEVQGTFVDDPRAAVERADDLLGEVVTEMTTTLNRRAQRLQDRWKGGAEGADTERLRLTLREYRSTLERLLELTAHGKE